MEIIRIIGRNSPLSRLQLEIVKKHIEHAFPGTEAAIITRDSQGDLLGDIPLHTVEGSDFFTADIFDALEKGEADIAVHSLKDMSSEHFFGNHRFAVPDRDDTRDIALFHRDIDEKIKRGEKLVIGTCSPRREEMAIHFLQKALPQLHKDFRIATKEIRGNVDSRLRKLDNGEYDGIILATAGLNRLLRSTADSAAVKALLKDKRKMLLPLAECVPAPCQGAVVAETHPSNQRAVEILERINNKELFSDCFAEKKIAVQFGTGCLQKFGVTTLNTPNGKFRYAAGRDAEGTAFSTWYSLPVLADPEHISLFSSTDFMKDFFDYEREDKEIRTDKPVVFIANYKSLGQEQPTRFLQGKTLFASGTKTWFELSRKGYWVEGCADALGFEFLLPSLEMPLLQIRPHDICILTHTAAAERWEKKGYTALSNYRLIPTDNPQLCRSLATAGLVFWSSFSQYEFYGKYTAAGVKHACAGGETAVLLKEAGEDPLVFPTIKSFQQWRNSFTPSPSAA